MDKEPITKEGLQKLKDELDTLKNIENLPSYEIYRLGLSRSFQITNIFPKLSVFENMYSISLRSIVILLSIKFFF